MEKHATQQEILLSIDSRFAQREWAEKEINENNGLSPKDQLEKACWDGLVKELIPEVDITLMTDKKLWLWNIRRTRSFLELEFCDYPSPKDNWDSIDPYAFLETACRN
ncbi:MAG TPA: hypothetical protein VGM24_07805 [Puia sp.]